MTLTDGIVLQNCGKERYVALYIEDNTDTHIKRGDAVNDIQEFECDDRNDDSSKPDAQIAPGYAQYIVKVTKNKLIPRCRVTNCIHNI